MPAAVRSGGDMRLCKAVVAEQGGLVEVGTHQFQDISQWRVAVDAEQLRADTENRRGLCTARHGLGGHGRQAAVLPEEGKHRAAGDDTNGVALIGSIDGRAEVPLGGPGHVPVSATDFQAPSEPVLGECTLPRSTVVAVVRGAQLQPLRSSQCGQISDFLRIALGPEQVTDLDQAQHRQQRQHDQHHGDRHPAPWAAETELAWAFHGLPQRPDEDDPLDLATSVSKKSGISCSKLLM